MKRFKEIRLRKKLKLQDAAKMLGVSQPTLSSWESERKSPSLEMLVKLAELYGVTTDYLLGSEVETLLNPTTQISATLFPILHGKPVWIPKIGWALVNAADNVLMTADGERIPFSKVTDTTLIPERFSDFEVPHESPIPYEKLLEYKSVWVEPISKDPDIRQALRGWYRLRNGFIENEFEHRFTLSSYGATWFAFASNK